MKALGFTPDRNYLHKRFLQVIFLAPMVLSLTVLGGLQIGHWINPSAGVTWGLVIGIPGSIACLGLAIYLIYQDYRFLFYEIHEDEVIKHAGMITRSVTHVPIQMIVNLKVRRSPFDRLFKLGTIDIQTAGTGDHHGATESLVGLSNFKEIYDLVAASMRKDRSPSSDMQERIGIGSSELESLRNLLEEMKRIRHYLQDHGIHQNHPG
jgi:membrane protein YdbS with pleckstrin-like domain